MNATINAYRGLIRSELREHRSLVLVPVSASLVLVLLAMLGFVFGNIEWEGESYRWLTWLATVPTETIESIELSALQQASRGITAGLTALFFLPMLVVLFGYLCGTLHDDRRDRSILFWKSLPIADHSSVLAKLAVAVLVVPAIIVACVLITQGLVMVMGTIGLWFIGLDPMALIWKPAQMLTQSGLLILAVAIQALWLLPAAGWLLLCSAYAPRVPWLFALAVPGALSIGLRLMDTLLGTNLKRWDPMIELGQRAFQGPLPTTIQLSFNLDAREADTMVQGIPLLQLNEVLGFLASGRLWLGLLVAAGLIALAIEGRRRAGEL
jgi:ABC-2 type transport system permease protein